MCRYIMQHNAHSLLVQYVGCLPACRQYKEWLFASHKYLRVLNGQRKPTINYDFPIVNG